MPLLMSCSECKLHEKPKPFLGKGSYLIPITTWKVARDQMRRWLPLLTDVSVGFASKRSYLTLVKIPDEHPVILDPDWDGGGNPTPMPLRDIPESLKDQIMEWYIPDVHANKHSLLLIPYFLYFRVSSFHFHDFFRIQ